MYVMLGTDSKPCYLKVDLLKRVNVFLRNDSLIGLGWLTYWTSLVACRWFILLPLYF